MTSNAPSLWSGGIEWGPAETAGATGYWQAAATPATYSGKPIASIAIAGKRIPDFRSGTWKLGRDDWLSELVPTQASFEFGGVIQANPNDLIVVSLEVDSAFAATHADPLWIGRVDSNTVYQDPTGDFTSTVSGTDIIGILGQARAPTTVAAGSLKQVVEALALGAGQVVTVDTNDALTYDLNGDTTVDSTVLEYINRAERSANALLFLQGNGRLRSVTRQSSPAGTVETIPLTGLDSPGSWTEQTSVGSVVNDWDWTDEAASWHTAKGAGTDPLYAASQALYGKRSFAVDDMLRSDATSYNDLAGSANALARPRAIVTSATFPEPEMGSEVLFLDPLDWVEKDDGTWQVMSVQHEAGPTGWTVTITADQTQNALMMVPDPTPVKPVPDPPPGEPDTVLITKTYTSTKSGTAFKSSGGSYSGNGAGNYLVAGYYGGGRARACIQFPVDWSDFPKFLRVNKAEMTIRTSTQVWVVFGSNPKSYVRRITNDWFEGSFDAASPNQYGASNALVWPGPNTSTEGQKLKSWGTATNNDKVVACTEIVQGWHDDPDGNHGLRIHSEDEDSSSRTIEFFSDDSAHPPTIEITCECLV